MVNRALPRGGVTTGLLAESRSRTQGVNMSARVTFLAAMLLVCAGPAAAACAVTIPEFESIVTNDVNTGNLSRSVYNRIIAEMSPVKAQCSAGRETEASRGLAAIKSRHGYR